MWVWSDYELCYNFDVAIVAQLVEQLIRNEQVAGSIPVNGSIFYIKFVIVLLDATCFSFKLLVVLFLR